MWTDAEQTYLASQKLGRLATIGPSGPQVRPVGFTPTSDTIDISGMRLSSTQKWRNVQRDQRVAFVVDDDGATGDGVDFRPRGVEIRGTAEAVSDDNEVIRVRPQRIISWGLDSDSFHPQARTV
jgi:pyridoxamine 5'-phosphate oxidase family protein